MSGARRAGAYLLGAVRQAPTLDIFLRNDDDYQQVSGPGVVSPEVIGALYQVDPATVQIFRMRSIRAMKISFFRGRSPRAASMTGTCIRANSTSRCQGCR